MKAITINCLLLFASACAWYRVDAAAAPTTDHGLGIFGGRPVTITEVPYLALLRKRHANWDCGASIISNQFLVSAAHCVHGHYPAQMLVTVGTDNVSTGENHEIENFTKHPYYRHGYSKNYDLSVIKLRGYLQFSYRVSPIPLMSDLTLPRPGDTMTTVGFGRTESGLFSNILLRADLGYVDAVTCQRRNQETITKQMICAGWQAGINICQGDSGGPLVYNGKLIGVVSFSTAPVCAKGPSGFAYIPSMLDFVYAAMKN